MESPDEEDDVKLIKASASLLSDLESALPLLLWRPAATAAGKQRVHTRVKQRDLDYVIKLIEPFQGEPQLLDARLKYLLPPLVEAYLAYLPLTGGNRADRHVDLETAVCTILYTLCKVRGHKVIVRFFSNEARYLEPLVERLERTTAPKCDVDVAWQVHYVLLLWLSHLLLTPFDLSSISETKPAISQALNLELPAELPPVAIRCVTVGLHHLPSATKAQDAAAAMLVRLSARPDMQKLHLGDSLVRYAIQSLTADGNESTTIYQQLAPLRFLSGIAASSEMGHLVPQIYRTCLRLSVNEGSPATGNAVAKMLVIKTFRSVAILSLRAVPAEGPLASFLQTTSVLEDVIDYLLRSLRDRDTPVRYVAAKSISLIVLDLDPDMGHEVIQAVLDSFLEDMPRTGGVLDVRAADPLRWHGQTLTLAHSLFKRTASPAQLSSIINTLIAALQFEQRTTTGSTLGTNVRDAANFGIWSVSRRYTTAELLRVDATSLHFSCGEVPVLLAVATQLILSACLDPAGNIRRGSSAALQELVGRHPNQVHEGISLVQIVEYQAVGLRRRATIDVSNNAAVLRCNYWEALVEGLLGWRGIGSPDVASREAAATSLAKLSTIDGRTQDVIDRLAEHLTECPPSEAEVLHGLLLSVSNALDTDYKVSTVGLWPLIERLTQFLSNFTPRILRSELPAAAAQLITSLCRCRLQNGDRDEADDQIPLIESLVERLTARQEESVLRHLPALVQALLALRREAKQPLGAIGVQTLCKKVATDTSKTTLGGAGRLIALGALAAAYGSGLHGEKAETVVRTLAAVVNSAGVDWRVIGVRALRLAVQSTSTSSTIDGNIANTIAQALHRGLHDYTIDERGDVGSLVRLEAIAAVVDILSSAAFSQQAESVRLLQSGIFRLSLEKLDRVRVQAAMCRRRFLQSREPVTDIASVSTYEYFCDAMSPLLSNSADASEQRAVLEGCISCAGVCAEALLQASRAALAKTLDAVDDELLADHLTAFAAVLKAMLIARSDMHPALELLAFLLNMQIPQRLADTDFKWRGLLSTIQKSHHKSNDIPKILAAVHVYQGLADVAVLRGDVVRKLASMLKTNPYPRVRVTVAEALFLATGYEELKAKDWTKPVKENADVVETLLQKHVID
ncbi:hypothetical protein BAUCODRAFT_116501 [Baudoinia panamericana UAMH 10762]|uniref:Uncharacterized protein n=1 Tax=Baudoinia panamericana (strain UAMH 10762) TaxID=717646 RepID=M2M4V4_BAUPA|nr:uncharacterized protein BAUCODRAFT_116501 [Baudoinia panamericana UAMH 10762]EMC91636.1 hypothetical protein BAUCODRAFT_116501 [Baudoinia panamericana UAMH 10762]